MQNHSPWPFLFLVSASPFSILYCFPLINPPAFVPVALVSLIPLRCLIIQGTFPRSPSSAHDACVCPTHKYAVTQLVISKTSTTQTDSFNQALMVSYALFARIFGPHRNRIQGIGSRPSEMAPSRLVALPIPRPRYTAIYLH